MRYSSYINDYTRILKSLPQWFTLPYIFEYLLQYQPKFYNTIIIPLLNEICKYLDELYTVNDNITNGNNVELSFIEKFGLNNIINNTTNNTKDNDNYNNNKSIIDISLFKSLLQYFQNKSIDMWKSTLLYYRCIIISKPSTTI
eukprot:UN05937